MMVDSNGVGPVGVVIALVALSAILVAGGFLLRRWGLMRSRAALIVWCVLTVVPIFVIAPLIFLQPQAKTSLGPPEPGTGPGSGNLGSRQ